MEQGSVLITGASSGFGEACARRYAEAGRKVVVTARRSARVESLAAELSAFNPCLPLTLDVRDRSSVMEKLTTLPDEFADIEILINNAGLALGLAVRMILIDEIFREVPHEPLFWDAMVSIGCYGPVGFYTGAAQLPVLLLKLKKARWWFWPLICASATAIGHLVYLKAYTDYRSVWGPITLGGICIALITGLALVLLLRGATIPHQKPAV